MEAIGETGFYDTTSARSASEIAEAGYTYFVQGDIVRARVTPCFENGKGAYLADLVGGQGLGTTELFVFSPSQKIDARFLYYVTISKDFTDKGAATMYGAHGVRRVDERFVRNYRVWLPSLATQRVIAEYLDRETGRIDALILAKKNLVELIEEHLEAQLLSLIDPHETENRLIPIRRILRKGARVATVSSVVTAFRDGTVTLRDRRREEGFTESSTRSDYQGVKRGDVVFHGLDGFAGAIGVSEDDGICSPVYHVCSALPGFDPTYVALTLRALALSGYLALQSGNVRERAVDFRNWDALARIPIPVPEFEQQQAVAMEYMGRRSWTSRLSTEVARHVDLLWERRRALVAAAIGGQLDIPEIA